MNKTYYAIVKPNGQEVTSFDTLVQVKRELHKYPQTCKPVQVTDGDQQVIHLSKAEREKIYGTNH